MDEANGAGLAAPQLGALRRILVYRVRDEDQRARAREPDARVGVG